MHKPTQFRGAKYFRERFGLSSQCLRSWHLNGRVSAIRLNGSTGKRMYSVDDILAKFNTGASGSTNVDTRQRILYARVSSSKQAEDLTRQVSDLKCNYPDHDEVIQDIGSGVNFNRKGLKALLERVYERKVREVVVMHRDRLARVGIELLQHIFKVFGVQLVVHCEDSTNQDGRHDDLIAIITLFVASHHGRRAAANCRRRNGRTDGRNIQATEEEKGQE